MSGSRSIDEINVQLIMERLGGGGHLNVAGAQLTDCSVLQAKAHHSGYDRRDVKKKATSRNNTIWEIQDKRSRMRGNEDHMKVILLQDVKALGKKATW